MHLVKPEGHCCVGLSSLPHFSIFEKSKLFIYLGLVINRASWQKLFQNSNPVMGTRL